MYKVINIQRIYLKNTEKQEYMFVLPQLVNMCLLDFRPVSTVDGL